jgi:8-oxo-dGTP diphosphatase
MPNIFEHKINPNVSVDNVILGFDGNELKVLLIERKHEYTTEKDFLALPGDLIYEDEPLDDAANRVLYELTGLKDIFLEQFYTFGDPKRISKEADVNWLKSIRAVPEARVITVAYYTLVKIENYNPSASGFASNAIWMPINDVPYLAFDHNDIFNKAIENLKHKLYRQPIGFELLPKKFTLAQLQRLYEIILQTSLDKRNFRRKILKTEFIIQLDEKQTGVAHKPAMLYKFDKKKFDSTSEHFPIF